MGGSYGNDMMDSSQNFSNPRMSQPRKSPMDQYQQQEKLRNEIQVKRQELTDLFHSEKPDKALIEQKVAELNELETAYDKSISGAN